ncbi:uncharacterized protein LOC106067529 [Biomphalaria glabrata]|uniref:Uncharacterized protein LOC106067529 n=1 Tax=Biomphalaria glabrata TaxID=6526 RepID=A0A9W2ZDM5_BIOGL|nr:uncharacterized protein LOC106067529 [Biomphalaria glabrata]XP_055873060.1 uncharacterized protein LOC106067529 [Biomphalaria glabrata]XP_055873061.1 uncharacterized protein LOC106067529 [Biomphalaria glabrata]XP_055873062.1 uncharacterized protein LOC106067529 [Biomphalaria glabrata]XP_055873063.1 uncharacterized protein LOC106067529 [Biomphalaria glabrata]XP_055873064.1 uncharacterized protein LOC106067529 [Biomphalaria glabrata]XP_055873065.1 uncharacterized protein LOC106067529 [Biomph
MPNEDNDLKDNELSEASTAKREPTQDNNIHSEGNDLKDNEMSEASTAKCEPTQDNNMPNEDNDLKDNELSEASTAKREPTQDNNMPNEDKELEDNVLPEALTAINEPTQDNNMPNEDKELEDNVLPEALTAKSEPTQDNNMPNEDNDLKDNELSEASTAKQEPTQDNNIPSENYDWKDNVLSEASTSKSETMQDNNIPIEDNGLKDNELSEASTAKREPRQVSSISSGDNHHEDFSSARNIDIEPKNQDQDDPEDNAQIAQHETHKKDDAFVGDEDLYFDCPEIIPLNEQNSSSGDMNKNKISEYTDSEVFSTNNDADEKDLLVKIYEEVTDLSKNVAKIVENSELQPSMPVNESSVNQSMGNNIFVAGNTTYVSGEGQQQQASFSCNPVVSSSAPSISLTINAIGSGSRESGGLRPYELPSHEACSSPVGIQTVTQTYVASPSTPGDSSLMPLEDNEVVDKSIRTEAEQVDNTFVCSVLCLGPEDCFKLDECESVIVILDTSTKMASMVPLKSADGQDMQLTKLEMVQRVLGDAIQQISLSRPEKRVTIVTFNNKVTVCINEEIETINDEPNSSENYWQIGRNLKMKENVQTNFMFLRECINGLKSEGESSMATPALSIALGLLQDSGNTNIIVVMDNAKEFFNNVSNDVHAVVLSKQMSIPIISFQPCKQDEDIKAWTAAQDNVIINSSTGFFTDVMDKVGVVLKDVHTGGNINTELKCSASSFNNDSLDSRRKEQLKPICIQRVTLFENMEVCLKWQLIVCADNEAGYDLRSFLDGLKKSLGDLETDVEKLNSLALKTEEKMSVTVIVEEKSKEILKMLFIILNSLRKHDSHLGSSLKELCEKTNNNVSKVEDTLQDNLESIKSTFVLLEKEISEMSNNSQQNFNDKFVELKQELSQGIEVKFSETMSVLHQKFAEQETKLQNVESAIDETVKRLEKMMLLAENGNSQDQHSSFLQFGSLFILAKQGDAVTNTIKINVAKIMEKPKRVMTKIYSNMCGNLSCQAFFSHNDECQQQINNSQYTWKCRFCHRENSIRNLILFSPDDHDISYIDTYNINTMNTIEDYKIIFVIDISGSMSVSASGLGLITRLDAVRESVKKKIEELTRRFPKRRIGLVTFCDKVAIYGTDRVTCINSNLENWNYLLDQGSTNSTIRPLETNNRSLISTLNSLKPDCNTALGPAILVSLGMTKDSRGSKIIVCTDGESNAGIGMIGQSDALEFYNKVATQAKVQSVTISINSFDDCQLSVIEIMARGSGGTVRRISPSDLSIHMAEDISKKLVATNTTVKVVLPREMYVHASGETNTFQSAASISVGNISDNNNHIMCFEFGCRPGFSFNNVNWPKSASENCLVPFQVQVMYQDSEGNSITRVYSMLRQMTERSEDAKLCMNAQTIVTCLVQKAAKELLKQNRDTGECNRIADRYISKAEKLKKATKIKCRPELLCKLNMFILVLNKIKQYQLTDEMSTLLSEMATIN